MRLDDPAGPKLLPDAVISIHTGINAQTQTQTQTHIYFIFAFRHRHTDTDTDTDRFTHLYAGTREQPSGRECRCTRVECHATLQIPALAKGPSTLRYNESCKPYYPYARFKTTLGNSLLEIFGVA